MKIKVYICCPYSIGDQALNVRRAIMVANQLWKMGYIPFNPLLFHFAHLVCPLDYEDWMMQDEEWIKQCDVLLRLSGESKGCDREVIYASKLGIPIITKIEDLKSILIGGILVKIPINAPNRYTMAEIIEWEDLE